MPKPNQRKKRIIYFVIFTLSFLVILPLIILSALGYTIDASTFGLTGHGGIYVYVGESDTSVYIGNDVKKTTGIFQHEVLTQNLKPRSYLVVVANDTFWPWAKSVDVHEGEVSALYPLLVPKEIAFTEIKSGTTEYKNATELFRPSILQAATSSQKLAISTSTISTKKMKVWVEGKMIFAMWQGTEDRSPQFFCSNGVCHSTIAVFQANTNIDKIDFYPGREDAILVSLNHGIYATELDIRPYHNFYPIYKGVKPDFKVVGSNLYIKDSEMITTAEI